MKTNPHSKKTAILILIFVSLLLSTISRAQYFGRTKVNYRKLNFQVLESPHFDLYHYLQNNTNRNRFLQDAEQWYQMHQAVLADTFKEKNPIIFYSTHADFQQTNAIDELIGVGTGGVTEALKNRVILPYMESNAQTDHVTGHELVHAFQYHLIRSSDSLSLRSLQNLPIWMVEGMAEYMSIGTQDPLTALWLRSAVLDNRLPTLKDLNNKPDQYFPYRWGEAFWAYVTGVWGDQIIKPLFLTTAREGYKDALKKVLHMDEKVFSEKWKQAIRDAYTQYGKTTSVVAVGNEIVNRNNGGRLNIVPSLSPDGKLMAFWTEKDIFTIDLYLADAATGKIIDKLTSNQFSSHIDEYSSFESSVAWSPDSRQIAFVAFSKGRNELIIVNDKGRIQQELELNGLNGFSNPTWSPDGKTIVVSGWVDAQTDLYAYDLQSKTLKQLTNDRFSDLSPSYSPDGKWIVFATDKLSIENKTIQHDYSHNIALYNVSTGNVQVMNFFENANNLDPVFANDNQTVYFVSDRDGFRNLYSYNVSSEQLSQLTNLFTGITGITLYAPAMSTSRSTDQIAYSYFTQRGDYNIYTAKSGDFKKIILTTAAVSAQAGMMPPFNRAGKDIVQTNIENAPYPLVSGSSLVARPYKAKFQLDYVSNTGGVGVTSGGSFGPQLGGGVTGIFSDILGNHQLYGALAINGEVYDFGGQFAYFNQNHRVNWGTSVSHVPYVSGYQQAFPDTLVLNHTDTMQVINLSTDILHTYQDQASFFTAYPFSTTHRIEGGASFARYYYRLDRYTDYYDLAGNYITSSRKKLPVPKGFNFGQTYIAYVGDNSQFGVASPLIGHRYRFEAGQYFGVANLQSLLADYRRYFRLAPFTLAARNMFFGRYGKDAESGIIPPFYIGDPYFIRGYQALDFATEGTGNQLTINDLLGSRIYVTNAELRFPFTGPERLSAIRSRFLFTELNLFTDGGIAWGNAQSPGIEMKGNLVARSSKFILSTGLSMRVNVFGYLIIEPYYAVPWQNGGFKNANFGLNFIPGW
jgi:Tol biopolymer transport system component